MEILIDPEEKILCPYNPSHHIRRKRMNTHLVKCKKSFPDVKFVECDFNVNHKIPEPELQYHQENCPDRKRIETVIYEEEGQDLNKYPIYNHHVPTEECWDDYNHPSYNPKENTEKRDVLRSLNVESAAKRREFRMIERKRLAQINSNKQIDYLQQVQQKNKDTDTFKSADKPGTSTPQSLVHVVEEDTPDSIADLINRIKIGSKISFIPKT